MEFKTTMSNSLGRFNWKLYLALLVTAVLPTVYTTVRINFRNFHTVNSENDYFGIRTYLAFDSKGLVPEKKIKKGLILTVWNLRKFSLTLL